ncbi:MAG: class I SAM-dependent methyltransferase, partial [Planctomycetota bacterium]
MTTLSADPQRCCNETWEAAYARFETPSQEVAKFRKRLTKLGALSWDRDLDVAELFCGRGNGLQAWAELGFTRLTGVDLSAELLAQYDGPAETRVADCRALPFDDASFDVLSVHGGLHHLPRWPDDLAGSLDEARRVLRPGGRLLLVEPWSTPVQSMVHAAAARPLVRRLSPKFDAFQVMYENERDTYERGRPRPAEVLARRAARVYTPPVRTAGGQRRVGG